MRNYLLLGVILCTILSCNQTQKDIRESKNLVSDSSLTQRSKTNELEVKHDLPNRAFLKTADIKFKVKDVVSSTYNIENLCNIQGAFVTSSNLESIIGNTESVPISADSSVEISTYSVSNSITIRVPNNKLDTVLKDIAANVEYLDSRIIKADDVSLKLLANQLIQNRIKKNETRLSTAIDNNNKKLLETAAAEDLLLSKEEQSDNGKIENLSLTNQINYSTVNLSIYQNDVTKRTMFANEKAIKIYEPGFGSKMADSLLFGWNIVMEILFFISKFWAILLAASIVYFLYKKFLRNKFPIFPKA